MLVLFEMATTEGWMNVMFAAVDNRGVGMQPVQDNNQTINGGKQGGDISNHISDRISRRTETSRQAT